MAEPGELLGKPPVVVMAEYMRSEMKLVANVLDLTIDEYFERCMDLCLLVDECARTEGAELMYRDGDGEVGTMADLLNRYTERPVVDKDSNKRPHVINWAERHQFVFDKVCGGHVDKIGDTLVMAIRFGRIATEIELGGGSLIVVRDGVEHPISFLPEES